MLQTSGFIGVIIGILIGVTILILKHLLRKNRERQWYRRHLLRWAKSPGKKPCCVICGGEVASDNDAALVVDLAEGEPKYDVTFGNSCHLYPVSKCKGSPDIVALLSKRKYRKAYEKLAYLSILLFILVFAPAAYATGPVTDSLVYPLPLTPSPEAEQPLFLPVIHKPSVIYLPVILKH